MNLRLKIQRGIIKFKKLHGDPHYVAMGMSIGVFISLTPTVPLHTVLAVGLSFILRGSKAAAAIGVWFSNPVTMPFLYYASYKAGAFLIAKPMDPHVTGMTMAELLDLGLEMTIAAIIGGILLGIPPAIAVYFITRKVVSNYPFRKATSHKESGSG